MIQGAQSIYRTVDILQILLGSQNGLTAREITQKASLPISTTHRILNVLCERGLARQDQKSRLYSPGHAWMAKNLWEMPRMVYNRYYDIVPTLVETFGYTGYLLCRVGYECLCLARVESTLSVQVFAFRPGESRLLGDGAGSFGILAFLDEVEIDQILHTNLPKICNTLLRNEAALRESLRPAKNQGYCFGTGFKMTGTASISVPIYHEREVVGAISLSGLYNDEWKASQERMAHRMLMEIGARA